MPDEDEMRAAWELYVELLTRLSVVELGAGEGGASGGASSLYTLFTATRGILKGHACPYTKGTILSPAYRREMGPTASPVECSD